MKKKDYKECYISYNKTFSAPQKPCFDKCPVLPIICRPIPPVENLKSVPLEYGYEELCLFSYRSISDIRI